MVGKMKGNDFTDEVHSLFTIFHSLKRPAFTLAEVLITLGIIGVVAALTLPSLITKYRNQAYVTQLKKTVSTLEQGFQLMKADDGVDKLQDTSVFNKRFPNMFISYASGGDTAFETYKSFSQYFKFASDVIITSIIDEHYPGGRVFKTLSGQKTIIAPNIQTTGMFSLVDGSAVQFIIYTSQQDQATAPCQYANIDIDKCDELIGDIGIDVNGLKKPNQYGRDVFWFWLTQSGKLVPNGGEYAAKFRATRGGYWKTDKTQCGEKGKPIGTGVTGLGCAGRVVENGWKIDY